MHATANAIKPPRKATINWGSVKTISNLVAAARKLYALGSAPGIVKPVANRFIPVNSATSPRYSYQTAVAVDSVSTTSP